MHEHGMWRMACVLCDEVNGDEAAETENVFDSDALESTLKQTVNTLRAKQQRLEDEQKQVNSDNLTSYLWQFQELNILISVDLS